MEGDAQNQHSGTASRAPTRFILCGAASPGKKVAHLPNAIREK
jgi:hypothetical protein